MRRRKNLVRGVLGAVILAMLLGHAQRSAAGESETKQPNILFIFSDDHATHAIGAYRGLFQSVDPTPNIDRLAREGMLFENSF